eukprot:jgi/Mesen1/4237/ME000022S03524
MSVDAELEVAVYIHNFHNLDLFQQGWYGIKVTCQWEREEAPRRTGIPSRVTQYAEPSEKEEELSSWQINDADSSFQTRLFRVKYSRQNIPLQEMVSFHLTVSRQLPAAMEAVSSQAFRCVAGSWHGVHRYVPLTFGAFHFVCCDVNVHTVLLSFSRNALLPVLKEEDLVKGRAAGGSEGEEEGGRVSRSTSQRSTASRTGDDHQGQSQSQQGSPTSRAGSEHHGQNSTPNSTSKSTPKSTPKSKSKLKHKASSVHAQEREEQAEGEETEEEESEAERGGDSDSCDDRSVGSRREEGGDASPRSLASSSDQYSMRKSLSLSKYGDRPLPTPTREAVGLLQLLLDSKGIITRELQALVSQVGGSAGGASGSGALEVPLVPPSPTAQKLQKSQQQWGHDSPLPGGWNGGGGHALRLPGVSPSLTEEEQAAAKRRAEAMVRLSPEEWLEERQALTTEMGALWNVFLRVHKVHYRNISAVLRERWELARAHEASHFVASEDLSAQEVDLYGLDSEAWLSQWRASRAAMAKKHQDEVCRPARPPAASALPPSRQFAVQDVHLFDHPCTQPIIFSERHLASVPPGGALRSPPPLGSDASPAATAAANGTPTGANADHRHPAMSRGSLDDVAPHDWRRLMRSRGDRKSEKHVVVFVHGFQGHHLDLRLIRNHWLVNDPEAECILSDANEDRTFDSFQEMGHRLAEEVAGQLAGLFKPRNRKLTRRRLSFVGHSIGNIIIRAALTDELMRPYLQYLQTFLSVSGPHLGYLYSSNSLFNGGLWVLKRLNKGAAVMHQLTFSDHPDVRQCYLFQLSQAKTFDYFKHAVLLSSPQDRYVPYHSARIEVCPSAVRDKSRGTAYAEMVHGCLGSFFGPDGGAVPAGPGARVGSMGAGLEEERSLVRCDVNFDVSAQGRNFNNFIGRTAHIDFLETDAYTRFVLWRHNECFT